MNKLKLILQSTHTQRKKLCPNTRSSSLAEPGDGWDIWMETARKKKKACRRTTQGTPQPEELRDRAWDGAVSPLSPRTMEMTDGNKGARGHATGHRVVDKWLEVQVVEGMETRRRRTLAIGSSRKVSNEGHELEDELSVRSISPSLE